MRTRLRSSYGVVIVELCPRHARRVSVHGPSVVRWASSFAEVRVIETVIYTVLKPDVPAHSDRQKPVTHLTTGAGRERECACASAERNFLVLGGSRDYGQKLSERERRIMLVQQRMDLERNACACQNRVLH